jgi:hypothetical protein
VVDLLIQDIIRKFRFDLPVGIEHDYASWEKIKREVSYALTQLRAKVKKIVCVDLLLFCSLTDALI